MDADRFDSVARAFCHRPSRRTMMSALLAGALAPILALADVEAKRKKKKKKKAQQPGCVTSCTGKTCGDDGCGGSCGSCSGNQTCQGGTCTCVPEPPTATCAGRCGTWPNNCGQFVNCPGCTDGKQCASNGSCAITCTSTPADTCQAGCGCSFPNPEGARYCVRGLPACPTQTCQHTSECPAGTHCHDHGGGCGPEKLCWPLCGA